MSAGGDGLPMPFEAINRHGLACFVVANLLTGLVNLSINTLEVTNDGLAFLILSVYLSAVGAFAVGLDYYYKRKRS